MIEDPGKGKALSVAKTERIKAWKKPKKKANQDKLREERIAEYIKMYGSLPERK